MIKAVQFTLLCKVTSLYSDDNLLYPVHTSLAVTKSLPVRFHAENLSNTKDINHTHAASVSVRILLTFPQKTRQTMRRSRIIR